MYDTLLFADDFRPRFPKRRLAVAPIPPRNRQNQVVIWKWGDLSSDSAVDRLRRASCAQREQLVEFCQTAPPKIATRLRVIVDTMDGRSQTEIGRASTLSQPTIRQLQRGYANRGPIALLEGRYGLAGRKSALPNDYQDRAVVSAHGSSVRRLAGELQVSKSAVHRLVAKAREIDRIIGIGGAYVNREHYLLIAAFAPRPEALQRQRPLRPTYVDLFATVSDKDWDDVEGCDRIVAYVVEQLHRVEWDGILHVVADPRLAAVAARPKWFGGRDDISIHAGTSAGIWRFVLRQLVRGRATGWQSVALRILRSIDHGCVEVGTSPNRWITEYLSMIEWRASRSGSKSVEFLPDAHHLLQGSPGRLLPLLQRARVVRDAKRSRSWVIRPLWR